MSQTISTIIEKNKWWITRSSLFIVFFWFGLLKVLDLSPADDLVAALHDVTIGFIPFAGFYAFLGLYEMVIGVFYLVPQLNKYAIYLLIPQMFATFLPLLFLPELSWNGVLVPTLIGQYILKNLVIIAIALLLHAEVTK